MTVRMSATENLTDAEATALDDAAVQATSTAALSLCTLNEEKSGAINGSATKKFKPLKILITCLTATGAPNGDAQITCGTSAGGTQICTATPTIGLATAGEVYEIGLSGEFPAIAGNATIYFKCTTADTKGGATCVVTARIVGRQVAI